MISYALINLKPGTGKTTSAVWLAYAFHNLGRPVLLVDADPAGSALTWSEMVAEETGDGGFPFRVAALPTRELHKRVGDVARPDDVVIIDAPQMEDHAGIARSAMRWADHLVIPVAPNPIELDRMAPVSREIDDLGAVRRTDPRVSVLLNRVVSGATSGPDTRDALTDAGWHVLSTSIPRLELYAQSWGGSVRRTDGTAYQYAAEELLRAAA